MRKTTKIVSRLLALILAFGMAACGQNSLSSTSSAAPENTIFPTIEPAPAGDDESLFGLLESGGQFSLQDVPPYSGQPYVAVNGNVPFFTLAELTTEPFELYSELDALGRCGAAYANICQDLMPTEERESISDVTPTGWINNPYDFVDGGYLFNRCHLIGFQLAGENANPNNLITGTRSMNVDGMLPVENMVADYVKETGNHVLYRVTPIYQGSDLVASGVLMEGLSVEDEGDGIQFCIYCYNVQDGVFIDYTTGQNYATGDSTNVAPPPSTNESEADTVPTQQYVLNTNSKKFHHPNCGSVGQISEKNRQDVEANREELIAREYSPCGNCDP